MKLKENVCVGKTFEKHLFSFQVNADKMVVGEASIHNIMGGMESTGGVRLHNHKRKLKQRFVSWF